MLSVLRGLITNGSLSNSNMFEKFQKVQAEG